MPTPQLNLRQSLVEQFWETRDPAMRRLLFAMSATEYWRLDSKEQVVEALIVLTRKLERAKPEVLAQSMTSLVQMMAYLSTPSAMLLLEWLSSRHENLALMLLETADAMDDRCGMLLIERVQTIKSMSLLAAIFSPENVRDVTELLRKVNLQRT